MKLSENWLREWVNPSIDSKQLAEQFTMLGLEVDEITPAALDFSGVVVGHVISREQHPNADRLSFCRVDVGDADPVEIVCGAANVRENLKVAVVKVGGVLPGDFKIKKAKLRGIESFGMICSASELGLSDEDDGILELPEDAPVGRDFIAYLHLNDQILDIDLTPNRGDCLSVRGLAREIAALNKIALKDFHVNEQASVITETFPVDINAPTACPRYVGRVIRNINQNATTPLWMQESLRRSGLRSIHPVVDVTNYVMLELGQPLHAFDIDKLSGGIVVRYAKKDETITLLDGKTLTLSEKDLVAADDRTLLALAGVMGGESSGVCDTTKHLFLESAFFDPRGIGRTARGYGLQTDSSYRFERGVDYQLQQDAVERATELLSYVVSGEVGPLIHKEHTEALPKRAPVRLRRIQIERLLGIRLPDTEVETMLIALGATVELMDNGWMITPPSYRFDLNIEVDVIEELGRLYGYDKIPTTALRGDLELPETKENELPYLRLQRALMDRGFHEAISYSFVDRSIEAVLNPEHKPIELANPLASDMAVMRSTLWGGLLNALKHNLNRQARRIKLFETGLCFLNNNDEWQQKSKIAGIVCGDVNESQWGVTPRAADFYDIKGDVETLLALTGQDKKFNWKRATHSALHPGQAAQIELDDVVVGYVGALHPVVVSSLNLGVTPFVFELDLPVIENTVMPVYRAISKYPAVSRDLAILLDEKISLGDLRSNITRSSGELLHDFQVFDVYQGDRIEKGKKSVAISLQFQETSRTLKDEEINSLIDRIILSLEQELNAKLRA